MDEALIKRQPPYSMEAEQSVIGSMIMSQDAITIASEILNEDDFYLQQFRVLYGSMIELYHENKPVDLITLHNKLIEKELPEELTSVEFISNIVAAVPISANVKYYADIVRDKSTLRRLIKITEAIANTCYVGNEPVEEILDTTEKKVFDLVQNKTSSDFMDIKDIVVASLASIEAAAKTKDSITGISTGFYELDKQTSGLQPSDLILIAARPSMGKTAFVLNLAEHIAVKNHVTTAIFSLEMSKDQLVKRMLSMNSKVNSSNIRNGNLSDEEWIHLVESVKAIGTSGLFIDDTPGISIGELRSKCRKLSLDHELGLVIIDYLQLMSGNRQTDSRQQEISDISRALKSLAREIHAPVIALSQLSRAVERRDDKRPMLSDLRESGAIEQDADVVMFLYRDEYYNKDSEDHGVAEVIIGKQRNGPTGTIKLAWLAEFTKFGNLQLDYHNND